MKSLRACVFAGLLMAVAIPRGAFADEVQWTRSELTDRIRGGWAGKMIGVVVGTPFEFRHAEKMYTGPLHWDLPTSIALLQDDLYVNMAWMEVLEVKGLDATQADFAEAFRDTQFGLYHANQAARRNLLMGIAPPASGSPPHNLHADDIDFQIEADFIGLISPALPEAASRMAFRIGPIINYGDGVYGGVFVANLYALAFVETDRLRLVEQALLSIPAESAYRRCVETVLECYRKKPEAWKEAWSEVLRQWDHRDLCPGGMGSPFNIDAKINGAFVALAFLFGNGDYHRTVEIAIRCGQDTDCNASTALGVLATMTGYARLPEAWRVSIEEIRDQRFSHVSYTFDSVTSASLRFAVEQLLREGATQSGEILRIVPQQPTPPETCEQWDDGIVPVAEIGFQNPQWKWHGQWTPVRARGSQMNLARTPPAEAEIEFEGAGVMLKGAWLQAGGRLGLQLDQRKPETLETFLFARGEMPHVAPEEGLWYSGPIAPGKHRLRLWLRDDAHPQSEGRLVGISSIIVFKKKEPPRRIPTSPVASHAPASPPRSPGTEVGE